MLGAAVVSLPGQAPPKKRPRGFYLRHIHVQLPAVLGRRSGERALFIY